MRMMTIPSVLRACFELNEKSYVKKKKKAPVLCVNISSWAVWSPLHL